MNTTKNEPFLPVGLNLEASKARKFKKRVYSDSELKDIIRSVGLKFTSQRLLILKTIFSYDKKHITAQSLFDKLSQIEPSLGFATVYRFLRVLTQKGFMIEVRMGAMPARYELTPHNHHDHLTCVYCGKIVEFEDENIEMLQEEVSLKNKFILVHHILELYGVCEKKECRAQYKNSQRNLLSH